MLIEHRIEVKLVFCNGKKQFGHLLKILKHYQYWIKH